MAKFAQGPFVVKNAHKYVGRGVPRYRSSWEWAFMQFCDNNENVLQWASEPIRIPYQNPLTGKATTYVPDFIVTYRGPNNTMIAELIEIKPSKQSQLTEKMNPRDRAIVAVNHFKWEAAQRWCKANGLRFRVITEDQIFHQGGKKRGK
jgi:hypothetical protein